MSVGFLHKFLIFLAVIFLEGCASYQRTNSSQCGYHPANSCVSVVPFNPSHTLDVDKENLPKPAKIEKKMHHMHHDGHRQNEKDRQPPP